MQRSRCILSQSERQSLQQCQILNPQQYIQVLKTNITLLNSTIRKCIFDPSHSSQPQKTEYFHHTQDKPMTIQRNKKHRYPRKLGKQKTLQHGYDPIIWSYKQITQSHAMGSFNSCRNFFLIKTEEKPLNSIASKVYTQFNLSKKPMN